jgi:hypothetical protein
MEGEWNWDKVIPVAGFVIRATEVFSILILIILKLYRTKRVMIEKVKFALEQATKALKGSRYVALLFP